MNRLEQIILPGNAIGDIKSADPINALNVMPGLHNLLVLDLGGNEIGSTGCVALCTLLRNPECRLQKLGLTNNCLDVECMCTLISGLYKNNTLKIVDLCYQKSFTETGWQMLLVFLSSPQCSLEKLDLLDGEIGDDCAATLGDSMAVNQIMKSLCIHRNMITPLGWRDFSNGLGAPSSALMELKLEDCSINVEGAAAIFQALGYNITLKKLKLSENQYIASTGWAACFQLLINSQSALEDMMFSNNNIDDEGADILVKLVARHMSTVQILDVQSNPSVANNGWSSFADTLLPNSTSKLKKLRIGNYLPEQGIETLINNDVMMDFVAALAGNSNLIISPSSQHALVDVLCDKMSFDSVCVSNHTLSECYVSVRNECPSELFTLLDINKNANKSAVVRTKLLLFCLLDKDIVGHVFGTMAETLLPSAIGWIGRDRLVSLPCIAFFKTYLRFLNFTNKWYL